jgi:hypothetical protein
MSAVAATAPLIGFASICPNTLIAMALAGGCISIGLSNANVKRCPRAIFGFFVLQSRLRSTFGRVWGLLRRSKLAFEPTDNLVGLEGIKPFALLAS